MMKALQPSSVLPPPLPVWWQQGQYSEQEEVEEGGVWPGDCLLSLPRPRGCCFLGLRRSRDDSRWVCWGVAEEQEQELGPSVEG